MNNISLAAKYRPQTFAQVVGQETIKTTLSRAALESKVAPAYLLSGTRGVGKTTLARVFAKALNCERGPTAEPCNVCSACKRITQGAYVDVMEIDGASNRGIEDAKRIREAVSYAPLEGRYKVIIIDEAHMLTKEAFNALLKTLEEPPSYTTFILATTEAHKFPITIISRCQHFVFKQVPETTLEAHLKYVLTNEEWAFEDEAVTLLARRAAGSVRDAMSLLGQTLALAEKPLTAKVTRQVLGLAGQDILDSLLVAIIENNTLAVARVVREMLGQGVDIGFFLRELGTLWRSFFLLNQHGAKALDLLSLSTEEGGEGQRQLAFAQKMSPTFIHAAWQMTLDSQRRISTSLDPAAALELLLLNLALMPQLLPLAELKTEIKPEEVHTNKISNALTEPISEKKELVTENSSPEEKKENIKSKTNENEIAQKKTLKSDLTYTSFLDFLAVDQHNTELQYLRHSKVVLSHNTVENVLTMTITPPSKIAADELQSQSVSTLLKSLVQKWAKCDVILDFHEVAVQKTSVEMKQELEQNPRVQLMKEAFNASIIHCELIHNP